MYEDHWQLTEKPFRNTPDPRFLFFSGQHEEALTRMLYCVTEDQGAMLLTGDYGCGKTLLSRALLDQLDPERFDIAVLPHPNLDDTEFLREILRQFGYAVPSGKKSALLHVMGDCLLANHKRGRNTIVLVDEAQMVQSDATLEEIRALLNFQRNSRFYLTLILVGQPELRDRVEDLPQLMQRLGVRYHLGALDGEDSRAYIRHRLTVAGSTHEIFTAAAEDLLVDIAEGVPRRINTIADMALLAGFGAGAPVVDDTLLRQAAADLEW